MTPEERASATMEKWMADPNLALAPISVTLMHVASAIREAENEALERAALAEEARGYLVSAQIAARIRSLKHPSPQREGKP